MENTLTTNHKQNLIEIIFYLLLTLNMWWAYFEKKTHLSIVSSVDARWLNLSRVKTVDFAANRDVSSVEAFWSFRTLFSKRSF